MPPSASTPGPRPSRLQRASGRPSSAGERSFWPTRRSLIRGIYRYHTHNLGWSDLGYNFLVDRFGRIWQGRGGGVGRPVRGAHTLGFNETSTGVAVLGTFTRKKPKKRVLTSLVRLAAAAGLVAAHVTSLHEPSGKCTIFAFLRPGE